MDNNNQCYHDSFKLKKGVFIYLGFYVAFNTVQVISRRVVGRAEEDFITDSFWYNFKIESFFLPNWYKAGIFCAADIMDSKGILPKITLEKKYKITINFLEYHRVKLKVEKLPTDVKDS